MMNETIKEYWKELNQMWGTDIEMPEDLEQDIENTETNDIEFDMIMGNSFDNAMQRGM